MPRSQAKYEMVRCHLAGYIPWDKLRNHSVFAVDEIAPFYRHTKIQRLYTLSGAQQLNEVVDLFARQGFPDPTCAHVLTAAARKEDLPDVARVQILQAVLLGINALKFWGDNNALRIARRELEREGRRPGPSRAPENNRPLIDLLFDLASGKGLKESVHKPWRPASASARLSRFCLQFYGSCFSFDFPEPWNDRVLANVLDHEYGFSLGDPNLHDRDVKAAKEAYQRGKAQVLKRIGRKPKQAVPGRSETPPRA